MVCCSEPLFVFTVFSPLKPQVAEGQMRIGRPRQLYVGPAQRHWKDTKVLVLGTVSVGTIKNQRKKHGWCHVVTTQIATSSCVFCCFLWIYFIWHMVFVCFVGMFFFGRGWICLLRVKISMWMFVYGENYDIDHVFFKDVWGKGYLVKLMRKLLLM